MFAFLASNCMHKVKANDNWLTRSVPTMEAGKTAALVNNKQECRLS